MSLCTTTLSWNAAACIVAGIGPKSGTSIRYACSFHPSLNVGCLEVYPKFTLGSVAVSGMVVDSQGPSFGGGPPSGSGSAETCGLESTCPRSQPRGLEWLAATEKHPKPNSDHSEQAHCSDSDSTFGAK